MITPYQRKVLSGFLCAALTLAVFPVSAWGTDELLTEAASDLAIEETISADVPEQMEEISMDETEVPALSLTEEVDLSDAVQEILTSTAEEEPITEELALVEEPVAEDDSFGEDDLYLTDGSPTDLDWANITWDNTDGVLTISGSGALPDCETSDQALWAKETYSSVVISSGLTCVGAYNFACAEATEATVPESVSYIGKDAFAGCSSLNKIYILNDDCVIYDSEGTLGDPDVTVIYCYYNSTAMAYAEKYDYKYDSLGYSNCLVELEITTVNSTEEPIARVYNVSATDLQMYGDIVKEESELPKLVEDCVVSVSEETLRDDGLYSRTIYAQNVEPGRHDIAVYLPGGYVIRTEEISLMDDLNLGERHMWLYGDVDNNGVIDARDATQVYRHASDLPSVFGSTSNSDRETMRLRASDVNLDGMYDEQDAQQFLCYITRQSSCFDNIP